ncbi:MAG: esterase-like activity of phytase family protein [Burkholderiaceae bacterium]
MTGPGAATARRASGWLRAAASLRATASALALAMLAARGSDLSQNAPMRDPAASDGAARARSADEHGGRHGGEPGGRHGGDSAADDADAAVPVAFAGPHAAAAAAATAGESGCAFTYIGQAIVDSGTHFADEALGRVEFGGLSGIDYDHDTGRYWAISDDRSINGPARFYELAIDLRRFEQANDADGEAITIVAQHALRDARGGTLARRSIDPEAIRRVPGGDLIAWSTEGKRGYFTHGAPLIVLADRQGRWRRDLPLPAAFVPAGSQGGESDGDRGVRDNHGFESLAVTPDGARLYAAVENALAQDGPPVGAKVSSPSRIIEYDMRRGQPIAQFVYEVEPLPFRPLGPLGFADNGLVELLALGDRRFLALERSFALGAGMRARLYWVDARRATDVSAMPALKAGAYRPAVKRLVLDLSALRGRDGAPIWLDNVEGFTLGPPDAATGAPTMVFVADNNFSWLQATQFIAVAVRDLPALIEGRGKGVCAPGR